jgi:hypothetical protein
MPNTNLSANKPAARKLARLSPLRPFLWLAGTEDWIVRHEDAATIRQLYSAIGATVLFTGILGGLAGGYAVHSALHAPEAGIAFGIFWGALILNLDRYLVMSIRKRRRGNLLAQIGMALPRLAIAVLMSMSIAKPLEMKIFERDLQATRASQHRARVTAAREKINAEYAEIPQLEAKIKAIEAAGKEKETEREAYYQQAIGEAEGKVGSGVKGFGPLYARKSVELKRMDGELEQVRAQNAKAIGEIEKRIERLSAERDARLAEFETSSKETDGLLAGIAALGEMSARDSNVKYAHWLIVLLIVAVDTAPIFVKLLTYRSPYEIVSQALEEEVRDKYEGRRSDEDEFAPLDAQPVFD